MTPGADPDASRVAGATTPGPTGAAVRRLDSLPASVSAPAGSMSPKPSARLYPPAGWSRADCASARATSAGGRAGWADLMKAAVAVSHASAAKKLYTGNVPPAGPDANRVLPGADTRIEPLAGVASWFGGAGQCGRTTDAAPITPGRLAGYSRSARSLAGPYSAAATTTFFAMASATAAARGLAST